MMQRPFRCAATLALLIGAALSAGCGSGEEGGVVEKRDESQMRVVGILYGRYVQANGAAPTNEQKFAAFLQQEPTNWNKLAPTPEQLLTSPRDGQPLVVVYGRRLKDAPEFGFPVIAHEKTGVDGQQMVIAANGTVELKSADEVARLFPSS
jgi:hypothetical protein